MSDPLEGNAPTSDGVTQFQTGTRPSETIGPYRLLQRIGAGGMGEVWLAEQTRPVHRQVALKVIKAGMDTAHVVARFEAERQALAVMAHPAIAQVFDAGATPQGRPYFVMEYVRGEAITSLLQSPPALHPPAHRFVPAGLRRGSPRASEGHHPPRSEAIEHSRDTAGRSSGPEDHRLWIGEGDHAAADRAHALHRAGRHDRHARVHEPGTGRDDRTRHRHAHRRLCAGRHSVRAADGPVAVRFGSVARERPRRDPPDDSGGGPAAPEHAVDHTRHDDEDDARAAAWRSSISHASFAAISTGSRCERSRRIGRAGTARYRISPRIFGGISTTCRFSPVPPALCIE